MRLNNRAKNKAKLYFYDAKFLGLIRSKGWDSTCEDLFSSEGQKLYLPYFSLKAFPLYWKDMKIPLVNYISNLDEHSIVHKKYRLTMKYRSSVSQWQFFSGRSTKNFGLREVIYLISIHKLFQVTNNRSKFIYIFINIKSLKSTPAVIIFKNRQQVCIIVPQLRQNYQSVSFKSIFTFIPLKIFNYFSLTLYQYFFDSV